MKLQLCQCWDGHNKELGRILYCLFCCIFIMVWHSTGNLKYMIFFSLLWYFCSSFEIMIDYFSLCFSASKPSKRCSLSKSQFTHSHCLICTDVYVYSVHTPIFLNIESMLLVCFQGWTFLIRVDYNVLQLIFKQDQKKIFIQCICELLISLNRETNDRK